MRAVKQTAAVDKQSWSSPGGQAEGRGGRGAGKPSVGGILVPDSATARRSAAENCNIECISPTENH